MVEEFRCHRARMSTPSTRCQYREREWEWEWEWEISEEFTLYTSIPKYYYQYLIVSTVDQPPMPGMHCAVSTEQHGGDYIWSMYSVQVQVQIMLGRIRYILYVQYSISLSPPLRPGGTVIGYF